MPSVRSCFCQLSEYNVRMCCTYKRAYNNSIYIVALYLAPHLVYCVNYRFCNIVNVIVIVAEKSALFQNQLPFIFKTAIITFQHLIKLRKSKRLFVKNKLLYDRQRIRRIGYAVKRHRYSVILCSFVRERPPAFNTRCAERRIQYVYIPCGRF